MISEERIDLLAAYFNYPAEDIRQFLAHEPGDNSPFGWVRLFNFNQQPRLEGRYIEYCFLTRKGRFLRLLDLTTSSVDVREAAHYIDSVEPVEDEIDIIWDENKPTKQFYLISDYCPPLYCGTENA